MKLTPAQFARVRDCLPRQRDRVSLDNLQVLNAMLYVAENGCQWRAPPSASATGRRSTRA
ncbi:transposase [Pseudoxanthomonas mexicana]|uniref:transposase n=1 Tax=Pseudoxanthomonas mexicana TaxID=128785 RepID=UPI00398B8965